MDAAAVVEKNENVAADLSGLLEGKFDIPEFLEEQSGYISTLKTWLATSATMISSCSAPTGHSPTMKITSKLRNG